MSSVDAEQSADASGTEAKAPSALVISRVIPVLIVVAATVVAGVWRLPQVRLWVVANLGPYKVIDLEAAMDDPNDDIATRACEQILLIDKPWTYSVSYSTLHERPSVALACLERVGEQGADEPEEDTDDITRRVELSPVSRAQLIASRLARKWLDDLSAGRADSCMSAHSAARALEFAEIDKTYPLMRCAVTAESAEIGECCVNQLGGAEEFEKLLDDPRAVSMMHVRDDYKMLVQATFPAARPQEEAEEEKEEEEKAEEEKEEEEKEEEEKEEEEKEEEEKEEEEKEEEEKEEEKAAADALVMKKQDWVLGLGCRLHFDDPAQRQVVSSFQPLIESPGCSPAEVPWQGYYSAQSWTMMCTGMYRDRRAQAKMSPHDAVCDSLKAASIAEAVGDTRLTIHAAISQARLEAESSRPSAPFVGRWFADQPVQGYRTGRQRRRRGPSPRASTASRQILGSMARQLFR